MLQTAHSSLNVPSTPALTNKHGHQRTPPNHHVYFSSSLKKYTTNYGYQLLHKATEVFPNQLLSIATKTQLLSTKELAPFLSSSSISPSSPISSSYILSQMIQNWLIENNNSSVFLSPPRNTNHDNSPTP